MSSYKLLEKNPQTKLSFLPATQRSPLFKTVTAMMVCGYYLAFFFMISHNYEGVHAQKDTTRPSNKGCDKNSWLYKQVISALPFYSFEMRLQTRKPSMLVGCHLFQRGRLVALPAERGSQLPDRAPPLPQDEPHSLPDRRANR